MKGILIGLLVSLCLLMNLANGLTPEETISLTSILSSFPSLAQIDPFDQYDEFGNDWGGSWTKPVTQICASGDGWDIQGIHCEDSHVTKIRFSNSFGVLDSGQILRFSLMASYG
jgi:hypothetical protein